MGDSTQPSLLEQLRATREEILAELITDIVVPLVRPKVTLRVKPVDHEVIVRQLAKREKATAPEARAKVDLSANAAVIAAATVEVLLGDGNNAESCTLAMVAEVFELGDKAGAADAVRALFARDGDILTVAAKVMEHSGYGGGEADETFAGN